MTDTQSQTESILDIIKGVDNRSIMLPEFQRDFRWELEQTFDLFDSLIRDIFVGTLIYGKPSFGMTLREIDKRPRRGAGSRARIPLIPLSTEEIKRQTQTKNLRIVLDGQQRITSLYRAITGQGKDAVYLVLKPFPNFDAARNLPLEELIHTIQGEPAPDRISVLVSDAYRAETESLEDDQLNELFDATPYARRYSDKTASGYKADQRIYRRAISRLRDQPPLSPRPRAAPRGRRARRPLRRVHQGARVADLRADPALHRPALAPLAHPRARGEVRAPGVRARRRP